METDSKQPMSMSGTGFTAQPGVPSCEVAVAPSLWGTFKGRPTAASGSQASAASLKESVSPRSLQSRNLGNARSGVFALAFPSLSCFFRRPLGKRIPIGGWVTERPTTGPAVGAGSKAAWNKWDL